MNVRDADINTFHYDSYENTKSAFDEFFGYIIGSENNNPTPLYIGEFSGGENPTDGSWGFVSEYIRERKVNWAYCAFNPGSDNGMTTTNGETLNMDSHGIIDSTW